MNSRSNLHEELAHCISAVCCSSDAVCIRAADLNWYLKRCICIIIGCFDLKSLQSCRDIVSVHCASICSYVALCFGKIDRLHLVTPGFDDLGLSFM